MYWAHHLSFGWRHTNISVTSLGNQTTNGTMSDYGYGRGGLGWMIAAAIRDEIAGGMMCLYDKNMKYVKCMHAK